MVVIMNENLSLHRIGLVLSGGGAKGAYEMGVWKALRELGLENRITGVSGTSVGALNGVMFSGRLYSACMAIWESTALERKDELKKGRIKKAVTKVLGKTSINAIDNVRRYPLLSSERLAKIIEANLSVQKLQEGNCRCYVTCSKEGSRHAEYFLVQKYHNIDDVKTLMCASAAIPFLFKKVTFNGKKYIDGGITDNTPILPLYDAGYDTIIVVYLDEKGHKDKRFYPEAKIIEISPRGGLGNFLGGALNFYEDSIEQMIEKGYQEAYEIL